MATTSKIYSPADNRPTISYFEYLSQIMDFGTPFIRKIGHQFWIEYESEYDFKAVLVFDNGDNSESYTVPASSDRTIAKFQILDKDFNTVEVVFKQRSRTTMELKIYAYAITYKERLLDSDKP